MNETKKARLDEDGTAEPLTRIVAHPNRDHCVGPWSSSKRPEYEDEHGNRTPLDHSSKAEPFRGPVHPPHDRDPLPWTVADGRGSLSEAVVLAAPTPGDPGRSIVAKGSRETCEFIAGLANAFLEEG